MIDALPTAQPCQHIGLLRMQLGRDDGGDRLPYDLFGCIAEKARGSRIPGGNLTVERFAYDGIVRGLDNSREPGSLMFRPALLGDVAEYQHYAEQRAIRQSDWSRTVIDGYLPSAARYQHSVIRETHDGARL